MYNIIYLNDKINYYDNKDKKIIHYDIYNKCVKNGLIVDKNKFIKLFNKMLKTNNIKSSIFNEYILVITPPNFSKVYKDIYKDIFSKLNYKIITFKSEMEFYKLKKGNIQVNVGDDYFYLTKTIYNKTKTYLYNIEDIDKLKIYNNKNYYLYGNDFKLIDFLNKIDANYYVFEDSNSYFLKKAIKL